MVIKVLDVVALSNFSIFHCAVAMNQPVGFVLHCPHNEVGSRRVIKVHAKFQSNPINQIQFLKSLSFKFLIAFYSNRARDET